MQEDVCDLGIVGLNVVEEKGLAFQARGVAPLFEQAAMTLDYGRCRLSVAVPEDFRYECPASRAGLRIATTYPHIVARWLAGVGVRADVVTLSGAVEIAPRLGRADVICDLVSTGSTLAANHLTEVDTVMESQAVLIRTPVPVVAEKLDWMNKLLKRMDGVQQVKESKYIMLHAPRSALPKITELLPGSEHPTIVPLEGTDEKVAVHAVCRENVFWETLETEGRRRLRDPRAARGEDARMNGPAIRIHEWARLAPRRAESCCAAPRNVTRRRPCSAPVPSSSVSRRDGDRALRDLTAEHDRVRLAQLPASTAASPPRPQTAGARSTPPESHRRLAAALSRAPARR